MPLFLFASSFYALQHRKSFLEPMGSQEMNGVKLLSRKRNVELNSRQVINLSRQRRTSALGVVTVGLRSQTRGQTSRSTGSTFSLKFIITLVLSHREMALYPTGLAKSWAWYSKHCLLSPKYTYLLSIYEFLMWTWLKTLRKNLRGYNFLQPSEASGLWRIND